MAGNVRCSSLRTYPLVCNAKWPVFNRKAESSGSRTAIRADVLIMGIGSVTEPGFCNKSTVVVGSEQKMIEVANKVIIVADSSKFGRGGMIPVAPLSAPDIVVSDSGLAQKYVDMLCASGVQVMLA